MRSLLTAVLFIAAVIWWLAVARTERSRDRMPVVTGEQFPLRVAWPDGRSLDLEAAPRQVLLGNAAMVDFATQLVPPDRIVALPEQALTWSRLAEVDDGFRAKVGFRRIDAELVVKLAPDLVLCSEFNQFLLNSSEYAPVLSFPMPTSLEDVRATVTLLGTVLAARERATDLLGDIDRRVEALERDRGRRAGLTAMVFTSISGWWSAGKDTLQHEMIELAGMRNVTAVLGKTGNVRITLEQIVTSDPEVLIVPRSFGEADGATLAVIENEEFLRDVRAVKAGLVIDFHPRLMSCASTEIITAAEVLARAVEERL